MGITQNIREVTKTVFPKPFSKAELSEILGKQNETNFKFFFQHILCVPIFIVL